MAAAGDIFRVDARVTLSDGQLAENVFQVRIATAAAEADARADLRDYVDDMYNFIAPDQANEVNALDIIITNVTGGLPGVTVTWPTYTGGLDLGEQLPPGTAALLTAPTGVLKARGRKFIPGMSKGSWDGQVWVGGTLSRLASFATSWITPFVGSTSGASWFPGVLPVLGAFAGFVEVLVRTEAAYQRRRKQGVGS